MVDVGDITRDEADRAAAAPLDLAPLVEERSPAPYVVEEVKRLVRDDPRGVFGALGETPDDRVNALFTGGYRVVTTVDPAAQRAAEQAVAAILPGEDGPSAAVVLTDPASGAIRAMVGGRDFYDADDPTSHFNLATQARRQPGSSFKPIVLATALERGVTLDRVFPGGSCVRFDDLPDPWAPCNYGGTSYASMTLREATVRSVNTVYARLGMEVGPQAVVAMARSLGLPDDLEPLPAIALGTEEVAPIDMAGAYGAFANGGRYAAPHLIERIEAPDGEVVFRHAAADPQVMTEATAYLVTQTLAEVVERGTGVRAQIDRPQAGKTGTSQDSVDAWFVGYTPDIVGAVWVGFPQGRVPMKPPTTPELVEGGRWPAEIWAATMRTVLADVDPHDFTIPSVELVSVEVDTTRNCLPNPYTPPELVEERQYLRGSEPTEICREPTGPAVADVPDVLGLPVEVAQRLLRDEGFPVEIRPLASKRYPPGVVELQRPAPGEATDPATGNRVVLWVSQAITTRSVVPDVVEVSLNDAIRFLEEAGWVPVVQRACPATGCTGDSTRVHTQLPAAGTTERDHSIVTVVLEPQGAGPPPSPTPTPDLVADAHPDPVADVEPVALPHALADGQPHDQPVPVVQPDLVTEPVELPDRLSPAGRPADGVGTWRPPGSRPARPARAGPRPAAPPRAGLPAPCRGRRPVVPTQPQCRIGVAQVDAVPGAVQPEARGQLRRAVGQGPVRSRRGATPAHGVVARQHPPRPQQHRRPVPGRPAHDVHAVVHPVGEVDVGVPGRSEHRGVAGRAAAVGVGGRVRLVVRLGLDDAHLDPGAVQVGAHQHRPQQVAGDRQRVPDRAGRARAPAAAPGGRASGRRSCGVDVVDPGQEPLGVPGVDDLVDGDTAPTGLAGAVPVVVVLAGGVGVGGDDEAHAASCALADDLGRRVEAVQVAVDLDGGAGLDRGREHRVEVELDAGATAELAPDEVPDGGHGRVADGRDDAVGLLGDGAAEVGVDRGHAASRTRGGTRGRSRRCRRCRCSARRRGAAAGPGTAPAGGGPRSAGAASRRGRCR